MTPAPVDNDEEPGRLEGHINAAEYWLRHADIYDFPNPARTECLQLAATHASLAQALTAAAGLHTYMVQRLRMRANSPLTFSDGERIVAVLRSEVVPGGVSQSDSVDVLMLVELPATPPASSAP